MPGGQGLQVGFPLLLSGAAASDLLDIQFPLDWSFIKTLTFFFVTVNVLLTAGNHIIFSEYCFPPHFIKGILFY